MMRHSVLVLGLLAFTAEPTSAQRRRPFIQSCDYHRIFAILNSSHAPCRAILEALRNADVQILRNNACSFDIKEQAHHYMQNGQENLEENCQGALLTPAMCHSQACMELLSMQGATCRTIPQGIQCAEMQVLQNLDCPDNVKMDIQSLVQQAQQYLAENCQGGAVPATFTAVNML